MVDLRPYLRSAGSMLFVAVRSFLGTMLLMGGLGLLLAGGTYYLLANESPWYGLIGATVAMLEAVVVGAIWGSKRAVAMALVHGLRRHRIGQVVVRLTFERLLGVSAAQELGVRGGAVARTVERLPLAQAEKRLGAAVDDLVNAPEEGRGVFGLRRWLRRKLLGYVRACTLARFREAGADHGGVDLLMVKADLEDRVDELLVAKVTSGLNWWTLAVLIGLPAQVFATVWIVLALLK